MCLQEAMPIVNFSVQPQRTTRNHPSYDITLRTPRTKHSLGLRIRRRSCSTCEKTYDIYNQRQGSHATRHAKTELLLHRVESKPLIWPSSQWKPLAQSGCVPSQEVVILTWSTQRPTTAEPKWSGNQHEHKALASQV